MKRISLFAAIVLLTAAPLLTSCGDDDDPIQLTSPLEGITGANAGNNGGDEDVVTVNPEEDFGVLGEDDWVATGGAVNISAFAADIQASFDSTRLDYALAGREYKLGVKYSEWNTPPIMTDPASSEAERVGSNGLRFTIKPLRPATTYSYRVYITVDGVTYYGAEKKFTTEPMECVTTGVASCALPICATLSCNIDTAALHGFDIDFGIVYSSVYKDPPLYAVGCVTKEVHKLTAEGDFTVELSGLSGSTTYYYRAFVCVGQLWCYGETKQFTTPAWAPADSGAIDLGLSVKWAAVNVGAKKAEAAGDYFGWGETKPIKITNDGEGEGDDEEDQQKNPDSDGAVKKTDANGDLLPQYDAATVNVGEEWRMPTIDEQQELCDSCDWIWTQYKGTKGYIVCSKTNNNYIFLPAAGSYVGKEGYDVNRCAYYWSASSRPEGFNSWVTCSLHADKNSVTLWFANAADAFTVRPVAKE